MTQKDAGARTPTDATDDSQFDLRDCIDHHVREATEVLRAQLAEANARITPTGFVLIEREELARLHRADAVLRRVQEVIGALVVPKAV